MPTPFLAFAVAAVAVATPYLAAAQTASPERSECSEAAARFAVGQPYSERLAEQARQAAGARIARLIEPGGAYTMELRPDRLDIEINRDGIVQRVRCG
jgi:hypothetical protein